MRHLNVSASLPERETPESFASLEHPVKMTIQPAVRIGKRYQNPVPTSVGDLSMMFKVLLLYIRSKAERTPKKQLGPFTTEVGIYSQPPASGLRITWFGHSSTLIEMDGRRILVDPVWDLRAAPVTWAGPRRFFPPTARLEDLPPLDAVLISHDHYDHLGAQTIRNLVRLPSTLRTEWVTSSGVGILLRQLGVPAQRLHELNWGDATRIGSVSVTAVPARHFSGRSPFNRFHTLWSSFVLAGPAHRIFYGADSGEWDGYQEIGEALGPFDLTMLEIGAFDPLWADIHMGPDGAVRTFRDLGGHGLLMPIHWGLFDLALHAWRDPIERISSLTSLKLFSPPPGQPAEVVAHGEIRSDWWR